MDRMDCMGGCKAGKQVIANPDLQRQSKGCKFQAVAVRSGKNRLEAFLESRVRGRNERRLGTNSLVAQLAEQRTVNPCVGGSSPPGGALVFSTEETPKS